MPDVTALVAALLPFGLMLLMFAVGLRLHMAALGRVFVAPRALAVGLAVQLLALPLAALTIAAALRLPAPMAAGLVLVAAAPGGVSSNYIAAILGADLALSVAMTLVTTLLAGLTLPLVLMFAGMAAWPGASGLARMSLGMLAVASLPMLAGVALAWRRPQLAATVARRLAPIAKLVFAFLVLATFVQNRQTMLAHLGSVGLAAVLLNLAALGLGAFASGLAGLGAPQRRAIMVEASLQNVAIAIFVAGSVLGDASLAVPGLIYAVLMNLSALIWYGMRSKSKTAQAV